MKYPLLLPIILFSSLALAGNGSGWGGAPALSDMEMQAMSAPITSLGFTVDNEVLVDTSSMQQIVVQSAKGIPVALAIDNQPSLVRPVNQLDTAEGKLELETPSGARITVRGVE